MCRLTVIYQLGRQAGGRLVPEPFDYIDTRRLASYMNAVIPLLAMDVLAAIIPTPAAIATSHSAIHTNIHWHIINRNHVSFK